MTPRLYDDLASWWPLLSPIEDYREEAALYLEILRDTVEGPVERVLELGSGGGNNAFHLRRYVSMTLVDVSPAMLEVSAAANPGAEHVVGDMRSVRLDRHFDAVFVHDAVDYMTTEADLHAAMETARVHLRRGGVALFLPDHVAETFRPATSHGGIDDDGRGLRYLEWTHDPDPADTEYLVDYAVLLREEDGVRVVHDRHRCGLFPTPTWLRLLEAAGLEARLEPEASVDGIAVLPFVGRRR